MADALHLDPAAREPERLLIVAREAVHDGQGPRFLLVRWADWPQPALLSMATPGPYDDLDDAVATLLDARLRLSVRGPARLGAHRVPVRMARHQYGSSGTTGWLRPVAVEVSGEPEVDALLGGCDACTLDEALAALSTDVERVVLREGAALL